MQKQKQNKNKNQIGTKIKITTNVNRCLIVLRDTKYSEENKINQKKIKLQTRSALN